MTAQKAPHIPVLLTEVVEQIAPKDGGVYVDATFGAGGYSRAVLDAADCSVYAIDRDPDAIAEGQSLVERYGGRLKLLHGTFGEMRDLLADWMHRPGPNAGFPFKRTARWTCA